MNEYIKEIKSLAKTCKFVAILDQTLRDRLVYGISSGSIQTKLLTEAETLIFEEACSKALNQEAAEAQSQLVRNTPAMSLCKLQAHSSRSSLTVVVSRRITTFRASHNGSHVTVVEGSTVIKHVLLGVRSASTVKRWAILVQLKLPQEKNKEEILKLGYIAFITKANKQPWKVKVHIESKPVFMEIYSGACKSVLHFYYYTNYFSHCLLNHTNNKLKAVTGDKVTIVGQINVKVLYKNELTFLPLIVIQSSNVFMPLMGRNWLDTLNPSWNTSFFNELVTAWNIEPMVNNSM